MTSRKISKKSRLSREKLRAVASPIIVGHLRAGIDVYTITVTANVGSLRFDVVENRVTSQNLVLFFKSAGAEVSRVSAIVGHPSQVN
jgi:hypothetical protein